jgi:hypothetical protein
MGNISPFTKFVYNHDQILEKIKTNDINFIKSNLEPIVENAVKNNDLDVIRFVLGSEIALPVNSIVQIRKLLNTTALNESEICTLILKTLTKRNIEQVYINIMLNQINEWRTRGSVENGLFVNIITESFAKNEGNDQHLTACVYLRIPVLICKFITTKEHILKIVNAANTNIGDHVGNYIVTNIFYNFIDNADMIEELYNSITDINTKAELLEKLILFNPSMILSLRDKIMPIDKNSDYVNHTHLTRTYDIELFKLLFDIFTKSNTETSNIVRFHKMANNAEHLEYINKTLDANTQTQLF